MSKATDYSVVKVKFFRGHDGDGFNATLLCNGKAVATVDDDGWGGGLSFNWIGVRPNEVGDDQKAFDAMIDALPLDMTSDLFPDGFKLDGDCFVEPLVTRFDNVRRMKRKLKSTVMFAKPEGGVYNYSKCKPTYENIKWVGKKHPNCTILNELPEEEAYKLFYA